MCVCVRARMCVCTHVCVRVCVLYAVCVVCCVCCMLCVLYAVCVRACVYAHTCVCVLYAVYVCVCVCMCARMLRVPYGGKLWRWKTLANDHKFAKISPNQILAVKQFSRD